jgi:radical S-adenosyl methionine domain-containing protein 2
MGDSFRLMWLLERAETKKLTFVGGEPTLYPLLPEFIIEAKRLGMVTMLVTNGTGVTGRLLDRVAGHLDAIKFSVDSPSNQTETDLGRGHGAHINTVLSAVELARERGITIMLNTVVTSMNWQQDMHELVRKIAPVRWKVFQVLPQSDMNAEHWRELKVTKAEFMAFVEQHKSLSPVAEDNKMMESS